MIPVQIPTKAEYPAKSVSDTTLLLTFMGGDGGARGNPGGGRGGSLMGRSGLRFLGRFEGRWGGRGGIWCIFLLENKIIHDKQLVGTVL